jgi:hypothetical protein
MLGERSIPKGIRGAIGETSLQFIPRLGNARLTLIKLFGVADFKYEYQTFTF